MPNKTIYVKDSDIAVWEAAQTEMGESISSLFSQFLRERVTKMDAFVHVLHSDPPGSQGHGDNFAVMIAPVGPTGSGGAMTPRYLKGKEQMMKFLVTIGFTEDSAARTALALRTNNSVSLRTDVLRSALDGVNYYRLFFKPIKIRGAAGAPMLLKVDLTAQPVSGIGGPWRASYHSLDVLLQVLDEKLLFPPIQLSALRDSLVSGHDSELGGHGPGVERFFRLEHLIELGMVESET
jgi:hypothetical protein